MHIPDGILPAQVSAVGYAIAAPLIGYSLRRINRQTHLAQVNGQADVSGSIPKAALLTATFFVASSLYLPFPPPLGSLHFLLNGLLGVMLGYYAIPAIVIGLLFQSLLLGHGGLTTLGINTVLLGVPALVAHHLFQSRRWFATRVRSQVLCGLFGGLAGFVGVIGAALLFFSIVIITIPGDINSTTEQAAISVMTLIHLPLALIEGTFTAFFVVFLHRTKPELLDMNGLQSVRGDREASNSHASQGTSHAPQHGSQAHGSQAHGSQPMHAATATSATTSASGQMLEEAQGRRHPDNRDLRTTPRTGLHEDSIR